MNQIIIKITLLIFMVLGAYCSWGQIAVLPNVSFADNDNRETIVQGEINRVSIKYQIRTGTEEYARNMLERTLKERVKWVHLISFSNGIMELEVDVNEGSSIRTCDIVTTNSKDHYLITQYPRADIKEFNVTGGKSIQEGQYCQIMLDGSEIGVTYCLYKDETKILMKEGTGGPIFFYTPCSVGRYLVLGEKNGLEKYMKGEAIFTNYSIMGFISFNNQALNIKADGMVLPVQYTFLSDDSGVLVNYRRELDEIVDLCNKGQIKGWNPEHQLKIYSNTPNFGYLVVFASPNISSEVRKSSLFFGYQGEIIITQVSGGNVKKYNVSGSGNIIYGQKFSIKLDGSQTVKYSLFRNGIKTSKFFIGMGNNFEFSGLTEAGEYTVRVECEGQLIAMNGSVKVRDINVDPPYVVEETNVGEGKINREITYLDGIGRVVQGVSVGASFGGGDVVAPVVRDNAGREQRTYLPYSVSGNGEFRQNAVSEQETFYAGIYGNNPKAYADVRFDNTPEDRVIEKGAPGSSWQLGGGHTTRVEYRKNKATDGVKLYLFVDTGVKLEKMYPENMLSVQETSTPQGDTLLEYIDGNGNKVARESRLSTGKKIFTYEVFDVMNRSRYIIPPLQDSMFTTGTKTLAELRKYCYYTEYDEYGRVYKHYVPGAGPVINMYDKRGRLVFTQDGEQRKDSTWTFTKYDELDRPIITGLHTGSQATLRSGLASQSVFGERRGTSLHGYTNITYPTNATENNCLVITYYDDYAWTGQTSVAYSINDVIGQVKNDNVNGLTTGTKTKILGNSVSQWLLSAVYYDSKYRAIQTVSQLYPSGLEVVANSHDFTGQVIRAKVKQTIGTLVTEYNKYFSYDQQGRLLEIEQQITGDNINGRVTLVENNYDEVGQLLTKKLHNGREFIAYRYNVEGSLATASSASFSYALDYDQVRVSGALARYDGNVNAMTWKNSSGVDKAYVYSYDLMGQLGTATYKEKNGAVWTNPSGKYNVSDLRYDLNGNIKGLRRNNASGSLLHTIGYQYEISNNGNAVSQIVMNGASSGTYAYNENGNMTTDGRTGVAIKYNQLKLSSEISKGIDKIIYIYGADGQKLAQQVGSTYTYYRGGMIYNDNVLAYIVHPEGIIRKNGNAYLYNYLLKDHLGSTRVVLEANGNTMAALQTTEYYPFGLAFGYNNLNINKYLFSGKEIQDVTLDKQMLGLYDFGARLYDPVLARWFCQDPASQMMSPYSYCGNNPVAFVDPNGESFLASFFIGAMANVMIKGFTGNDNGNFWKSYLVGGLAGVAGIGAGKAVSSVVGGGFLGGAASGAAGGAAGGFVGGAGEAWMNGASFGQGLKAGLVGGGIGGVVGGVSGGLIGGISDYFKGYGFWDGVGETMEFVLEQGGELPYHNELMAKNYANGALSEMHSENLRLRIEQEFNVKKGDFGIKEITTRAGKGYGMDTDMNIYNMKGQNHYKVGGYVTQTSKGSIVRIAPNTAVSGDVKFRAVVGHELIHAYHNYVLGSAVRAVLSERVAYQYTIDIYARAGEFSKAFNYLKSAVKFGFWGNAHPKYVIPKVLTFY